MSDTGEFHFVSSRPVGLPFEAAAPSTGKFGPKKSWRGTIPQRFHNQQSSLESSV
jgi:hypothetical protein